MNRPVFILGLQKSGTSLLVRLLEVSGLGISTIGRVEDNWFWGHRPSFSPTEWPAGTIYQNTGGDDGHQIGERQATEDIVTKLREKLTECISQYPNHLIPFGKSPYNTVRVPWVRAIFPGSIIVAMIRHPVPNVFSLWKRYHPRSQGRGPEEGWWGVKPKGWRELVQDNKIHQAAHQWNAVNSKLLQDRPLLDMLVTYRELCAEPEEILARLYEKSTGHVPQGSMSIPSLRCFDDEYTTGSRLESKNRFYLERGDLKTPEDESTEVLPLTENEVQSIHDICGDTSELFELY